MKAENKLFDILLKVSELSMDIDTAEKLIRKHLCDECPNKEFYESNTGRIADEEEYRLKYEKCIDVVKRFDAGIIGMYDL